MREEHQSFDSLWTAPALESQPAPAEEPDLATTSPGRLTDQGPERPAERRRRERLALIEEFGGSSADLKKVAMEAIRRGMYSRRTNRGDVELCLIRTWKLRHRAYAR